MEWADVGWFIPDADEFIGVNWFAYLVNCLVVENTGVRRTPSERDGMCVVFAKPSTKERYEFEWLGVCGVCVWVNNR